MLNNFSLFFGSWNKMKVRSVFVFYAKNNSGRIEKFGFWANEAFFSVSV